MALTSRQMEQCCPHFKAGTIVLSVEIYNRKYMHMLQKTFQVDSVTDVFGLRTCWPERFMFKEEMLVSVFLAESFLFSFLIDRCHLFRRRQEFLLFPCACTSSISCCCCCDSPSFRSVEKNFTIIVLTLSVFCRRIDNLDPRWRTPSTSPLPRKVWSLAVY